MAHRMFLAAFAFAAAALAPALLLNSFDAGIATAAVASADISSAGPLTHVYIGTDLSCQIAHSGDSPFELFPPAAIPGDCGTFVITGGTLYAPDFASHDGTATDSIGASTPLTPVSQSAVAGSGTSADPLTVTTVADVGTTGLRITEIDTYIIGAESYRTDVTVENRGAAAQSALIFRAGDCFLGGTDDGFGMLNPATKAIGCAKTAGNVPPDRIEVWSPITPADHYFESRFDLVWGKIGAKTNLPDTCDCATSQDNAAAIEWDRTLDAGASVTLSHFTTLSPLGSQPLVTSKAADAASASPGGSDGYTITFANPNAADVTLTSIADTLPPGFSYESGSSSGLTTADPAVAGQVLTWTGSFTIAGGSSASLHFAVTVASTPGTYFNNAGGVAATDVVPTGNTAPITVTEGATATATATSTSTSQPTATDTPTPTATSTPAPSTPTVPSCGTPAGTARATRSAATQPSESPAACRTGTATASPAPDENDGDGQHGDHKNGNDDKDDKHDRPKGNCSDDIRSTYGARELLSFGLEDARFVPIADNAARLVRLQTGNTISRDHRCGRVGDLVVGNGRGSPVYIQPYGV